MQLFLSWSRRRARDVAVGLHGWLPLVVPGVRPWVSTDDLAPGQRIGAEVSTALADADCGIVILTPDNTGPTSSWWIPYEAGYLRALGRHPGAVGAIPLLVDGLTPGEVPDPLRQFAALAFDEEDMLRLVVRLARALPSPRSEASVSADFGRHWPRLERDLLRGVAPRPHRQDAELLSVTLNDLLAKHGQTPPRVEIKWSRRMVRLDVPRPCDGALLRDLADIAEHHQVTVDLTCPGDEDGGRSRTVVAPR
jgi:hypothetical protein